MGFGITAWFWFHNPFTFRHSYSFNQFVRTYIITGVLVLLIAVLKTGNISLFLLFGMDTYDNHLNFYNELPEVLVLLPTFFFLNIWVPIRAKYRVGNWFWYSIIVYCTGTAILGFSSPIDPSIVNANWYRHIAPYSQIVDKEVQRAKSNGVFLDDQTIETLKFLHKQRVVDRARFLKRSFESEHAVSITKIVEELILIKKSTLSFVGYNNGTDQKEAWPFVLPRDVYRQLTLSDDSLRSQYLKEIMLELQDIFLKPEGEPTALEGKDGLYEKYANRSFMQLWYKDVERDVNSYADSLKLR